MISFGWTSTHPPVKSKKFHFFLKNKKKEKKKSWWTPTQIFFPLERYHSKLCWKLIPNKLPWPANYSWETLGVNTILIRPYVGRPGWPYMPCNGLPALHTANSHLQKRAIVTIADSNSIFGNRTGFWQRWDIQVITKHQLAIYAFV